MIFWTWGSYFICWQIFENNVWCPVRKKKKKVLSLFTFSCISYWQAGLGIVQCCNIVPSLISSIGESWDSGLYFAPQLPRGFDHFYGAGRGGHPCWKYGTCTSDRIQKKGDDGDEKICWGYYWSPLSEILPDNPFTHHATATDVAGTHFDIWAPHKYSLKLQNLIK